METPPPDKPATPEKLTADKSVVGQRVTKRMKQLKRDTMADKCAGIIKVDDTFVFAGDFSLMLHYVIDRVVRHSEVKKCDPLQIFYDMMHQLGYAKEGTDLILPEDNNAIKKPGQSGDGAPLLVLPNGKFIQ